MARTGVNNRARSQSIWTMTSFKDSKFGLIDRSGKLIDLKNDVSAFVASPEPIAKAPRRH